MYRAPTHSSGCNGFSEVEGAGIDEAGFAGVAALDAADAEEFFAAAFEVGFGFFHVVGGDDNDHAYVHVEGLEEFVGIDFAELGEIFKDGGDGPGAEIDDGFYAAGKNAGKIAGNAAAGDVGEGGDPTFIEKIFQGGGVTEVRLQEFGADFVADFGDVGVGLELGDFEGEFAGEGVAVGVEASGGKGEERVAGLDIFAGENVFAFDDANDEAGEIVLAHRIEARHFGGFAAD